MIAVVYILPVLACLLLHFQFDYRGEWWIYLCVFAGGEALVALLHYFLYKKHVSCYEYLGSIVTSIHFEEEWTEKQVYYETRTDSKGRSYTVRRVRHIFHPEIYYYFTSTESRYATDEYFFYSVRDLWQLPRISDRWTGSDIVGGVRFGCHYSFDDFTEVGQENPENWVPVTELHSYKNKIQKSNSIFKYERISEDQAQQLGLYDYPVLDGRDIPCILSQDFPIEPDADSLFRKFNGRYGPEYEMRMFILIFPAEKGAGISELQRAYWEGANKNEFVVCVGLNDREEIEWARAFSWADEQTLELEAARWLMDSRALNWRGFFNWMRMNGSRWKRKEFKDFDYINVPLPQKYFIIILFLSLIENGLTVYLLIEYGMR